MAQAADVNIRQIVCFDGTFGPREIGQIVEAVANDFSNFRELKQAVKELENREDESPATNVRLGVCLYLIGEYQRAEEVLRKGDGGALARFYLGKACTELKKYDEALKNFEAAKTAGYNSEQCDLARVEVLRLAGRPEEALAALDELAAAVQESAEYFYQRAATLAALGGDSQEIIALYERAVEVDPNHAGALFGLALQNDRYGNDEVAIELYRRSASRFPPHLGALMNLGILYEDYGEYDKAAECYRRILEVFPDHEQARMYLKDAEASKDMYYDEEAQKRRDRLAQILNIPVSDFELSVRSRNCLQRMGIMTLGDLCRCTEQQLLASKNFGETSLQEIKEMLASKGLRLGMLAAEQRAKEAVLPEGLSPDEQALLSKPVSDLNLSVRARKCMNRLGITTVGELIRYSGDELLECKNFGVTSLNEVREKLAALGLKLRGD